MPRKQVFLTAIGRFALQAAICCFRPLPISPRKRRSRIGCSARLTYDELTNLPTRRAIERRANGLLQREPPARFALAFLDIDNFKHINDYYGHAMGDALLIELAQRLGLNLRETDMLSRISGDEFLLLLDPIQSAQEVVGISSRSWCNG